MADQNQDGKGMISSGTQPGPGETLRNGITQAASSPGKSTSSSSAAGSSGGIDTDYMAGGTGSSAAGMREGGSRIASQARQYADDIAGRAKEKSRTLFDQQKETAVGQVSTVANAIRSTASQLEGDGQDQVARYVGMLADQLENLGGRLREKDLDALFDDAQRLARRSPATFFIGSVAAGFLLARFLKSSSTSGVEYRGYSSASDDWNASADSPGAYSGATTGSTAGTATGTMGTGTSGTSGTVGTSGTGGTGGNVGTVGSGGMSSGRGVGADGTPGSTGTGTTMGSSATPLNGTGGTSI